MATKAIDYYILNVKVLPPSDNTTQRYSNLITRWFNGGFRIKIKGDNENYYKLRKLDSIQGGEAYYGVITRYFDFERVDFTNEETGELIPYPITENAAYVRNEYEFVFLPFCHRFAFIQRGKIDDSIEKGGGVAHKKMRLVIKTAFDNGLEVGEEAIVDLSQDQYIFEEIFENDLLALEVKVSYTNDDLNPEAKEVLDTLLRRGNIGKLWSKLSPDGTGRIDTSEVLPKGLLELAQENGQVSGRLRKEDGTIKNFDSEENPEKISEEIEDGINNYFRFLTKIINRFRERYRPL